LTCFATGLHRNPDHRLRTETVFADQSRWPDGAAAGAQDQYASRLNSISSGLYKDNLPWKNLALEAPLSTRFPDDARSSGVNGDGLANFFDRACTELLAMEEANRFASSLSVHPRTYDLLASLREREVREGYGLVILGLPVEKNGALSPGDFHIVR
jgi:hypothetical protein